MRRIRVADPAERDLDDIWYYIAKKSGSINIADRIVDSITETFYLFARAPEAGMKRDEIEAELRGFPLPTTSSTIVKSTSTWSSRE